jgi:hypothetical protein
MSEATKTRTAWMNEVRAKQEDRDWTGVRAWRAGRLYDIDADNKKDSMQVYDVSAGEPETWDRGQFLSLALRVEQEPVTAKQETVQAPKPTSVVNKIWGALNLLTK